MRRSLFPQILLLGLASADFRARGDPHALVHGITISCQTWGIEWASPELGPELERLGALGANWVAIHPYARIHADGRVTWRSIEPEDPPAWLAHPIREAHARGFKILVKPQLAWWGSPFSWPGDVHFDAPEQRARFWQDLTRWVVELARATRDADAFCVATELERMQDDEDAMRALVAAARGQTRALLTYAANWTRFDQLAFWDALDAVGVQAYFPLSEAEDPGAAEIRRGWQGPLARLHALHERTGKPIVFTELGYNRSLDAARTPWAFETTTGGEGPRAEALQARLVGVALEVLEREHGWLRGAFLWKWFVGPVGPVERDFRLDTPALRAVIERAWGTD
jgi:hypothetical protein